MNRYKKVWQGWQDLNLRMRESKSRALPLGDTPKNKWGGWWESNPRPQGPQSCALTNWATPAVLVRLKGFEPLTHGLEGRCSIQLSYRCINNSLRPKEIGAGDGNRTHAASLEGWNSTIELHPRTSLRMPLQTMPMNYIKKSCGCQLF